MSETLRKLQLVARVKGPNYGAEWGFTIEETMPPGADPVEYVRNRLDEELKRHQHSIPEDLQAAKALNAAPVKEEDVVF